MLGKDTLPTHTPTNLWGTKHPYPYFNTGFLNFISSQTKYLIMQSLKSFCQEHGVSAISAIKENVNKFLYITVIRDGVAENIYLSKSLNKIHSVGESAKALKDSFVTTASNAAGEPRLKICSSPADMVSVDDIWS